MSADDFTALLESKSRRVRRWATRRHIEQDGYRCQTWYDEGSIPAAYKELTMERYLGGPGSVVDPRDPGIGDDPDHNTGYCAPYGGEVWNHVFGQLDWVDEEIMRFGRANLIALRDLITDVGALATYLRGSESWRDDAGLTGLDHFEGAAGDLASGFGDSAMPGDILLESAMQELCLWTGATATAYTQTFGRNGEEWEQIAYNNYALAEYLVAAAEAQLAVFITARESVANVCDKTIEALWGVNDSGDAVGFGTALTVLGAVVGVALTLATGGMAAPAVIAAGFSITNAIVTEATSSSGEIDSGASGEEIEIGGDTAMDVLDAMRGQLSKVVEAGREKETEIKAALDTANSAATYSAGARSTFEITFAADTPADDMGERDVAMSTGDLESAATSLFPRSGMRVLKAHALLADSTGESEAFASEFDAAATAPAKPWAQLRDLLQDLTAANGAKIQFAGEFLLDYAVQTGAVDEDSAERIKTCYTGEILPKDLPAAD